jgi:hypothetical protein
MTVFRSLNFSLPTPITAAHCAVLHANAPRNLLVYTTAKERYHIYLECWINYSSKPDIMILTSLLTTSKNDAS